MNTQQKVSFRYKGVLQVWGMFLIGVVLTYLSPYRPVLTPSVPMGIYKKTNDAIQPGVYVTVCLPSGIAALAKERGYVGWGFCEGWTQPVTKMVAAIAGDDVHVDADGVMVNGKPVPHSQVLIHDSKGRPLPQIIWGTYRIPPGYVWAESTHVPNALDSRYFGPISRAQIITTARPVWILE